MRLKEVSYYPKNCSPNSQHHAWHASTPPLPHPGCHSLSGALRHPGCHGFLHSRPCQCPACLARRLRAMCRVETTLSVVRWTTRPWRKAGERGKNRGGTAGSSRHHLQWTMGETSLEKGLRRRKKKKRKRKNRKMRRKEQRAVQRMGGTASKRGCPEHPTLSSRRPLEEKAGV